MREYNIALLAGDGIGPEICDQAVKVLAKVALAREIKFHFTPAAVGGIAIDEHGEALPKETLKICAASDAILFGAVGGEKWEGLPLEKQPERAALLPLRKQFNLFANFRPAIIYPPLLAASPLKNEILQDGLDILILRELTGDIYFGQPKMMSAEEGKDTMHYLKNEVERIAHLAFKTALRRNKKVTSIDKANVLSTMVFWRKIVSEVGEEYPEVTLQHMYVDNAAMQLVKNPAQFDVMLCPNMFGDILSDEASMITGSIGMLPSASINSENFGLYEPISGSAPDIAGKDLANPIAQIVSAAMMLEFSFNDMTGGKMIRDAVTRVLARGYRTSDIKGSDIKGDIKDSSDGSSDGSIKVVGTREMGDLIAGEIR